MLTSQCWPLQNTAINIEFNLSCAESFNVL